MADERIEIETNIDVTPSIAALRKLKQELRNTTDPAEFKRLQQQIDDTQDAINGAKLGAGNFADVLSNLPGPIGDIAGRASGLIGTLKVFGQLKLTDIRGSFVELGKDLVDSAKGLANLTGITKVYTVLNQALARSFIAVGVGEQAAAVGARAFAAALTATGIGAIVVALGFAVSALMEYVTATDDATDANAQFEKSLAEVDRVLAESIAERKRQTQERLALSRNLGEAESKQRAISLESLKKDLQDTNEAYIKALAAEEEQRITNGENLEKALQKRRELETKKKDLISEINVFEIDSDTSLNKEKEQQRQKAAQAQEKANSEAAKLEADRLKKQQEAQAIQTEAELSLLDAQDREILERTTRFNNEFEKLKEAGYTDFTALEEEFNIDIAAIDAKFKQERLDKQKEADDKIKEENQKQTDLIVAGIQERIDALDKLNEKFDNDFALDIERLEEKRIEVDKQRQAELANAENDAAKQIEIRKKYADLDAQIDKDITNSRAAQEQARRDIALQYADVAIQLGNVLQQAAGKNKALAIAGLVIEQAAGVARIVINTQAAAAKAGYFTPVGIATLAAGALSVTAAVIATKKGIDQIRSQQIPGGGGGGGGSASTPSASAPSFSAPRGLDTPQIQSGAVGTTPQSQLAQTIGQAQNRPIVAQVVSSAVSSQQALDRRNAGAATFGP